LASQSNTVGGTRVGIAVGLGYEYQLNKSLWLAAGVDFVNKGVNIGTIANVTQYTRRLNYYEVPVALKYKYFLSPSFQWGVFGGVNLGFIGKAEDRFFRVAMPVTQELTVGSDGLVNSMDLGFHIGGELNFTVDYGQFSLYALFQPSIGAAMTDPLGQGELTNRVIQAGFLVKFGKAPIDPKAKRTE